MKKTLLLPHRWQKIGIIVLIPSTLLLILSLIGELTEVFSLSLSINNIREMIGREPVPFVAESLATFMKFNADSNLLGTLIDILFIIGCILTGFSKIKNEDEYYTHLRLQAVMIAVYTAAAVQIIGELCCWGISYLVFLSISYKIAALIFIIAFYIMVAASKKNLTNEE